MINYNLVGGALVHCTKIAECRLLLVDGDFQGRVINTGELKAMGVRIQVVDRDFRDRISSFDGKMPDMKYSKNAHEKTKLALRYTSGTTGYPKGVMATTGRYYARLAGQFTQMGIRPLRTDGSGDRWYICMPMCHSTAGSATLICLLMPTTLCIGLVDLVPLTSGKELSFEQQEVLGFSILGRGKIISIDSWNICWRDCTILARTLCLIT